MSYLLSALRCRASAIAVVISLAASACAAEVESRAADMSEFVAVKPSPTTSTPATTPRPTTSVATTTTTTTSTTTTTTEPLVSDAASCTGRLTSRRVLSQLAESLAVDRTSLWFENGRRDVIEADTIIDTCVGNGRDDVTGTELAEEALEAAVAENVRRQQEHLNQLFADFGTSPLDVDGVAGPRTAQRLCAARLMLGLDVSIDDMAPGSIEQALLFATDELPTPSSSALGADRWALIDLTCQMMFVGSGDELVFVFPTSTGSAGFDTRQQDRSEVFRFNPALDNGGWHDSTEYPVGVDNPLNGNLYKPLYFDLGQAIHGANNVPPTPESKGCARLTVRDQDTLVAWLGLDGVDGELWRADEIDFVVNVQGAFVARS